MERSKRRHLTAPECEALAQSAEGSSPLRQPLSLGRGRGGGNQSLHPIHRTRRHPRAPARQRNILEFFGILKAPQVGTAGVESCGIQENPRDPFPGAQNSYRSSTQSCGIQENPRDPFPGAQNSFRSSTQSCGIKENPRDPFSGSQNSYRSSTQSCGIKENPRDPFSGSQNSYRSSTQSCGIKENPRDPFFPGSQDSFRSSTQSCGIKENPRDPFPGAQNSFRSTQSCGIKENPLDPFPGSQDPFRSTQSCGIKENPLDPFPGSQNFFRSSTQSCGIKEEPRDPSPGAQNSFRSTQSFGIKENPRDPFPGFQNFFRSSAQSCGIKENPRDPFPGFQNFFRSSTQSCGIKENPLDPFPGSQNSFRSSAQSCGIKENPRDPFPGSQNSFRSTQSCGIQGNPLDPFPGSQDSFRSSTQSCGIKEEPRDPFFSGAQNSFRSTQSCGIKENPRDPFPGAQDPFRSTQSCGIKENPLDPFPGSQNFFRSTQSCGIKEEPMDPFFPGSQDPFRSSAQSCGIQENPRDPFPGSQNSFRSSAQSCGIKEEPLDPSPGAQNFFRSTQSCGIKENPLDPFPGSQNFFRSSTQSCGIKENPRDPSPCGIQGNPLHPFPGSQNSYRSSTQSCGIKENPRDPFPGSQDPLRSTQSCGIKENPRDPFFPGAQDPFRSTSSNPSPSLHSQHFVPPPRGHSRKRALPAAASGIPNPQQDLWEEPEEKIPAQSGIKREREEEPEVEPLPDSHYGLLGTRNWEVPQGSLDDLPAEILRNIFAFLPVLDLYQNLSLVCRCWREIIQDPLFIPWKKLYHRYLKGEESALQRVEQILQEFSRTQGQQGYLLGLVRLVSSTPTGPRVDPSTVLQILGRHPLFPKAQVCVLSKFPDLMSRPGPEKMWATFAVMVLFSDGVGDIQRLLECLRSPRSQLTLPELIEALHCMATLLFAIRERRIPISNRIHYNIFYCLYLMENASGMVQPLEEGRVESCPGGWADLKLTHEQQRILNHKIEPGQTMKIMALAGTGKTSTLVKYAEKFPELKFLYLAFNKAVTEKGKKVFPRNVTCKTFHSLAYGSIGRYYKEKGKLNFSKMSVYSISFLLQNREGQSLFVRGKTVSQTLENFFSSSDEEICEEHTPLWFKNTQGRMELMSRKDKEINVEEAREIWRNMKKLDGDAEKKYKMTSDGYLKLWQLSKPQLSGYDAIFVDEAQDCTPAIMDIVQSQKCGKILVGDPHQQIYTFRGAVNTLYIIPHTHLYYLTQSFRFGPEIAYVGSTILDVCKGIRTKPLLGGNQKGDIRVGRAGPAALLSRSNWNVFEDAVKFSGRNPPAKIHVIGGLERFGLNKIYDIWKLSQPEDVRKNSNLVIEDSFIKKWEEKGFGALKEYAERVDDRDLEVKISIVEKYRERIPELVMRIRKFHVARESLADYLIGTVHQAKGLEFDTVWVADDFVSIPSVTGAFLRRMNIDLGRTPEDEWNLLYVAVTRAKKCLLMSQSLENLLSLAGERFLRVELSEAGKDKEGAPITCCMSGCTKSLEFSSRLVVKKLPLTHSNGSQDPGGFLCQACTWQLFGPLTPLTSVPKIQSEPIQL